MMFRLFGRKNKSGFAQAMVDSFPSTLPPPEPLVRYFKWLEKQGLDETSDGTRYARVDPSRTDYSMFISPVDPNFAIAWSGSDNPEAAARMAAFARTGGDGYYAGLWRDDDGKICIVHHGSGSGSTLMCKLTDDPVDFLRLVAIGYEELCWPENYDLTPEEAHARMWQGEDDIPPMPAEPYQLRQWVEREFNVCIPMRAAEIVKHTADMDAPHSDDPFWQWIRKTETW